MEFSVQESVDKINKIFFNPIQEINIKVKHQDATYLSAIVFSLTLFYLFLLFIEIPIRIGYSTELVTNREFISVFIVCLLSIVTYILSRTIYYSYGAVLTLSNLFLVVFILLLSLNIVTNSTVPLVVITFILLINVILTSVLYKIRTVVLMIFFSVTIFGIIPIFVQDYDFSLFLALFLFFIIISTLTLIHTHAKFTFIHNLIFEKRKFQKLFKEAPTGLWEEDFSKIQPFFDKLSKNNISDIRKYLDSNPQEVEESLKKVKLVNINHSAKEIFGTTQKENGGEFSSILFQETKKDLFKEQLIALGEGKTKWRGESSLIHSTGERIFVESSLSLLSGSQHRLSNVLTSCVDFTQRKKNETNLLIKDRALNSSITAVAITDNDERITYVNPAFLNLWGFTHISEVLNKPFFKYWYDSSKFHKVQEVLKSENNWKGDLIALKNDGTIFDGLISTSIVFDPSGNPIRTITTIFDITTQKETERLLIQTRNELKENVAKKTRSLVEQTQRIETILEKIPDGILVLDMKGSLVIANKSFRKMYTKIFSSAIQEDFNLFQSSDHIFLTKLKQLITENISYSIILEPQKDFHVQIQFVPIIYSMPNSSIGSIIQIQDVSSNIEFDNLRKQFVSMVSHELRNPITVIALTINNMRKYKTKLSENQIDELVEKIHINSSLLSVIIEDLLILSRIEAKSFTLNQTNFPITPLIKEIISQLEPNILEKKIQMKYEIKDNIQIFGDRQRIGQVIRNIIDNAIKYSPSESLINVKVSDNQIRDLKTKYHQVEGSIIEISDTGLGIKKKDLPNLFDRFFRGDNVKNILGTGLGLAICKDIIDLHNGDIMVTSEVGKGSVFTIFFPQRDCNL